MTSPQPLSGTNMLHAALWWANQGCSVLPLHHPTGGGCSCRQDGCSSVGKHPIAHLVPHGLSDASSDPGRVRDWWVQEPYANVGIRTGEIVDLLDIDSTEGLTEFARIVERLGGKPRHLGVAQSGRDGVGMHFYVAPGGMKALAGGKTAPPGIDVKGRLGYAVVPPSLHASGRPYRWVGDGWSDGVLLGDVDWETFYRELEIRPQRPPVAARPVTEIPRDAADAYGRKVLSGAVGQVLAATAGNRWQTVATDAIPTVARAVAGGCVDRDSGVRELEQAAHTVGLDPREITRIGPLVDQMTEQGITHPIRPTRAAPVTEPVVTHATEEEARADPWDPPWPLRHPTPPFPVDETMGWMAKPVKDLAAQMQCPVDLVAMMTIAAISAAIRGRIRVRFIGDWDEPLNLYIVAVLGPGETKSPALSRVIASLREMEEETRSAAKEVIASASFNKDILDARAKSARETAIKYGGENHYETVRLQNVAREAAEQAAATQVPVMPLWLAGGDMTPEALTLLLAEQGGALAHLSAEGELFDTIVSGHYSGGNAKLTGLLTAHDGREPIRVHRRGADLVEVPHPCLTLGLAVQPQVLAQLGKSDAAMRRGLAARVLFSVPESLVGRRDMIVKARDGVTEQFDALLRRVDALAAHGSGSEPSEPPIVDWGGGPTRVAEGGSEPYEAMSLIRLFSESSSSLVTHYRELLEPRRAAKTGDLGEIGPWANKIDGHVIRLAGVLQLLQDADPTTHTPGSKAQKAQNPGEVGVEATSAALVLMDYLIAHAIEAHAIMNGVEEGSTEYARATQLLGWIEREGLEEFTAREAGQVLRKRATFRNQDAVHQACVTLTRLGWIRYVPPEPGTTGRPSTRYLVHPDALR